MLCVCSIKGDEIDKSISLAQEKPDKFILKPQRDGGGECHTHTLIDFCITMVTNG